MTTAQLGNLLASITGYADKVAYYSFPISQAPALPYIIYYTPSENGFSADGVRYYARKVFNVELYTESKSETEEGKIETLLTTNGIYFTKVQSYIDDEKMWLTTYTIEV